MKKLTITAQDGNEYEVEKIFCKMTEIRYRPVGAKEPIVLGVYADPKRTSAVFKDIVQTQEKTYVMPMC